MDTEKTQDALKDRFPHHPEEAAYFEPAFHREHPEAWHAYHQTLRPSLQVRIIFNAALKVVSAQDFVEEEPAWEPTKIERREQELVEAFFFLALGERGRLDAAKAMKRYDKLFKTFAFRADYPEQFEQAKRHLAQLIVEVATDDPRKSLVKKVVQAFLPQFPALLEPVAEAIETLEDTVLHKTPMPALTRIRVMNLLARSVHIEPDLAAYLDASLQEDFNRFLQAAQAVDWQTADHDESQPDIEATLVPLIERYVASLSLPEKPFHKEPVQADYYLMQRAIGHTVLDEPVDALFLDPKVLKQDEAYLHHIEALLRYGLARPFDQENLPESQYNYLSDRGYHRFPEVHASRFNKTLEKVAELLIRDIHGLRE
ncbi:MAG: hypothetical protein EA374_00960 [Acholeplasmatales bacterium]|nr:MAG: hypothetical protein EA374_00960 [Acholeplasmatales bacterium]